MIVHVTEPAAISFPVRSWIVCENSHWTSLLLKVIEEKLSRIGIVDFVVDAMFPSAL